MQSVEKFGVSKKVVYLIDDLNFDATRALNLPHNQLFEVLTNFNGLRSKVVRKPKKLRWVGILHPVPNIKSYFGWKPEKNNGLKKILKSRGLVRICEFT